jgi:hypothetical protein
VHRRILPFQETRGHCDHQGESGSNPNASTRIQDKPRLSPSSAPVDAVSGASAVDAASLDSSVSPGSDVSSPPLVASSGSIV